ncbi:hypothetical protein M422DRAFT_145971, partial [Sphaerobolus stellatus SS14]
TQPGRSDHKLLTNAVEKLEGLLALLTEREKATVGARVDVQAQPTPSPKPEAEPIV